MYRKAGRKLGPESELSLVSCKAWTYQSAGCSDGYKRRKPGRGADLSSACRRVDPSTRGPFHSGPVSHAPRQQSIPSTPTLTASSTFPTQNVSPSLSAAHTDAVRGRIMCTGIRLQCLWLDAGSHTRMGCNTIFRFLSCCLRIPLT